MKKSKISFFKYVLNHKQGFSPCLFVRNKEKNAKNKM